MPVKITWGRVLALLRSLPAIRFALMLGAGIVTTTLAAWLIWVLGYISWPEGAAPERAKWLGIALAVSLGVHAVVIVTLGWGKAGNLKLNLPGGVSAEVDFDDEPAPHVPAPGGREL